MRDVPIIFSAPMVLALLREAREPGTGKSMTRRLAWGKPRRVDPTGTYTEDSVRAPSPWQRVKRGDRLWVRESLQCFNRATAQYIADLTPVAARDDVDRAIDGRAKWTWKNKALPSIHMPRWVSRLTLIVTETKVERLHQISRADVLAEGALPEDIKKWEQWLHRDDCPGKAFGVLWDSIHGKGEWDKNPEVIAVRFKVHAANIDAMKEAA